MARTLTKQKPIVDTLWEGIISASVTNVDYKDEIKSDEWEEIPVSYYEFFRDYIREECFPVQEGLVEAMVGHNPVIWDDTYDEVHGFWGKGSGKDRTISKTQIYVIYKLLCMKNPQKVLREKYGCVIGDGDAIDIGNMSFNARQAKNVYFKKFKQVLKIVKNPKTGQNWFSEKGVDLREGYDLQSDEVRFPHAITCHSLNSESNTGEGLNLFFATIDELGTFNPSRIFGATEDEQGLLDKIRDSVESRFPKVGKVCCISYKYYQNDPMDIVYEKGKNDPRIYSSKAATWEVNLLQKKSNFAKKYANNPEKAKMTYECEGGTSSGGYVTKKYMLSHMFSDNYENPVVGNLISIDYSKLLNLRFKEWFKPTAPYYAVHADMASGKVKEKNDACGFSLGHPELMKPVVDEKLRSDLMKEGIVLDSAFDTSSKKGIITDLAFQIIAPPGSEVEFQFIRKFILLLRSLKFNITHVTYDGWQSTESQQMLRREGIKAETLSVDRDNSAYDLWKELMYQQIFKCYPQRIAHREAEELIMNDKGKVDHPEKSWTRELEEGVDKGSKDVMDAIVGMGKNCYDNIPVGNAFSFG